MALSHGDQLGDGRRWCGTCRKPVDATPGPLDHLFAFGGKKCPVCKHVWPEHVAEFLSAPDKEGFGNLMSALTASAAPPLSPGDRIRLVEMPNDPDPLPPGTEGTVLSCAEWGATPRPEWQVDVDWEGTDRELSLCVPPDRYEVISRAKPEPEAS